LLMSHFQHLFNSNIRFQPTLKFSKFSLLYCVIVCDSVIVSVIV
jgi:hypothetical protein